MLLDQDSLGVVYMEVSEKPELGEDRFRYSSQVSGESGKG